MGVPIRISILLCFLLGACTTQKKVILTPPKIAIVPFNLATSSITNNPGGRWFFNGEEMFPDSNGDILITQSGTHNIEYRYYLKGDVFKTSTYLLALPPKDYCSLEISTPKGRMVVELSELAPRHGDHFEELVESEYYDSLVFHRIIPGFVVQGGNAEETPFLRSTNWVEKKEMDSEFHDDLLHYRGALAMARMPDQVNPNKKSSPDQFYVVQGTQYSKERWIQFLTEQGLVYKSYQEKRYLENGGSPQLDGDYTVFGYVTHGLEVLDSLAYVPTSSEKPLESMWMKIKRVQ